jgi:hypothetical protein
MHGRSRRQDPPLFSRRRKILAGRGGSSRFYGMESIMTNKPEKLSESRREKLMQALDKIDGEILQIEHELAGMGYNIPMLVGQTAPAKRANQGCQPLRCRPATSRPSRIRGAILAR